MKHKPKTTMKVGEVITLAVGPEHIRESDPCNKDNCMMSRAFISWLLTTYGGKASDFKVKSTNHGATFELRGRKYLVVFDSKTAATIYKYDQTFRQTRNKEKARSIVQPFKSRLMVESTTAAIRWPPMSDETKARLRALPKKQKAIIYTPKTTGTRRELSL